MSKAVLHLDKSNSAAGLRFEKEGKPVSIEEAFRDGFQVTPNDAPALLSLALQFLKTRDESAM